jgi:superfamily II DNA or RNA helicase
MVDYSYQIKAADKILELSLSGQYIATILAASPSSGKSTIIIHFLNKFLNLYPDSKIALFTHNLNNLKDQMLDGFFNGHVKPNFTFGEIGQDVQVQVGVISSGLKVINNVDLVVFDEAHQFYLENMANTVLEKLKPKYVIGMTGTPSFFNTFNKLNKNEKFGMHYISAEELVDLGVFSSVVVDIAHGDDIESKLKDAIGKARQHGMDMSKIIVATKDQLDANMAGYILRNQGRKVAVSTSHTDPKNILLTAYKNNEYDTLVIVNKGVLGFSDNDTTGLIDLRTSSDIDCRSQIFARVLRKHPKNIKKFYISAVNRKSHNKEAKFLYSVVGLMERKNFISYTK